MEKQVIYTSWVETFACPGGDCGLTCCSDDWKIALSDKEVEDYKKLDGEFGERVKEAIDFENKCLRVCDGRCALLNKNGFCEMVLNIGSEALSITCGTFPRVEKDHKVISEIYVEILCPLVAEKLFENKNMAFSSVEMEVEQQIDFKEATYVLNMFILRTKLIEIIQNNYGEYLHGKIFLIRRAVEYIQGLLQKGEVAKSDVDSFIYETFSNDMINTVYSSCEKFSERRHEKSALWLQIFTDLKNAGAIDNLFRVLKKDHEYIYDTLISWQKDLSDYTECFDDYCKKIKEKYIGFEQNYFVYILLLHFIDNDKNKYGEKLCGRLMELIVLHLIGMAILKKEKEIDVKEFSVAIAAIDRVFSHTPGVLAECGRAYDAAIKNNPITIMDMII